MKFTLKRASICDDRQPHACAVAAGKNERGERLWEIEFNTLEELTGFQAVTGRELILGRNVIEIYDDYRE